MAEPSLVGLIDRYGIALIHPRCQGRIDKQIPKKQLSHQRWIVGGKLCPLLNHLELVINWVVETLNIHDGSASQDHFKKTLPCAWDSFKSWVGYTLALFNILVQQDGLEPDKNGYLRLSIAKFRL